LNVHGLAAYEAAEAKPNTKTIPGFEVDRTFDKDDFKRISANNTINFAKRANEKNGVSPVKPLTSIANPSQVSPERVKHYQLGKTILE